MRTQKGETAEQQRDPDERAGLYLAALIAFLVPLLIIATVVLSGSSTSDESVIQSDLDGIGLERFNIDNSVPAEPVAPEEQNNEPTPESTPESEPGSAESVSDSPVSVDERSQAEPSNDTNASEVLTDPPALSSATSQQPDSGAGVQIARETPNEPAPPTTQARANPTAVQAPGTIVVPAIPIPTAPRTAVTTAPATTAPSPAVPVATAPATVAPTTAPARPTTSVPRILTPRTVAPTTRPPITVPATAPPTTTPPTTAAPTTTTTSTTTTTAAPEREPAEFSERIDIGRIGQTSLALRFTTTESTNYTLVLRSGGRIVRSTPGFAVGGQQENVVLSNLTPGTDYTVQTVLDGPRTVASPEVPFRTSGGDPEPAAEQVQLLNARVVERDSTRFQVNYESNICANGSFVIAEQGGAVVGSNSGQAQGCTTRHLAIPGFWTPALRPNTTYVITITVEANGAGQGQGNTATRTLTVTTAS